MRRPRPPSLSTQSAGLVSCDDGSKQTQIYTAGWGVTCVLYFDTTTILLLANGETEAPRSEVTGPGPQLASGRAGVPTQDRQLPTPHRPLKPLLTPSSSPSGLHPPPPALAPNAVGSLHSSSESVTLWSVPCCQSFAPKKEPQATSASRSTSTIPAWGSPEPH